ncbi:hypothetical protein P43SY_007879 [Pythium insidiosum]|uniref:Uncharacterized protein n=1 Tax=Pythium insidiosum TaxID=114742 RepID=A0AAD5LIU9_PYTIN|nr:hypothetical protein P43SY_007879 [Pythium insidiosum]
MATDAATDAAATAAAAAAAAQGQQPQQQTQTQTQQSLHPADAEARKWWSEREAKAEKDLAMALHKRMEAQRSQIHAFKVEQSKWEHELQLRISKYAHDRKLLSEHNIELQEAVTAMEERLGQLQRDMDQQSVLVLELEGQLRQTQSQSERAAALQAENEQLRARVLQLESSREAYAAAAVQRQEHYQSELFEHLETQLQALLSENKALRRERPSHDESDARAGTADDEEPIAPRLAELERICKQKDQTIMSLKAMLEKHETISDVKIKTIQSKYDQVKAINIALQRKLLLLLQDDDAPRPPSL